MSMTPRQRAIERIAQRRFQRAERREPVPEIFGSNVFSFPVMRSYLPANVWTSIERIINGEAHFDESIADAVAEAMKTWAIERGATHYAHVFFPLTGLTAEKHDSFYDPVANGASIARFNGSALIQGESDASSFPSGGIRQTFEARGYTAWDVSSPAYLYDGVDGATLCIPTAFISWTGDALDQKTPVLRSGQALDLHARRLLQIFGHKEIDRIQAFCGPEQEYFLIDRNFYYLRPDLMHTGRALFGAPPPKGQEFGDHYFGAIPDRVLAYMAEVEYELFKLGVPAKTRHNEVAPSQYEIAPLFESANIATDHQALTMMVLKRVARKHGFVCLVHEKPFSGVNGSGKHLNWSFGNTAQGNLLAPTDTPQRNAQFLVFCAAVIRAVSRWGRLLSAIVASAGNDHRLGGNEAPPAILSVFLGKPLTDIFEHIGADDSDERSLKDKLRIGVDVLADLSKDAGDRNRTSPFAFVGNRFEFRSVGANQSIAGPITMLNTIVAESLAYCADRLDEADVSTPQKLDAAVQELIRDIYHEHKGILFDGDGYSNAWRQEAARRGIPNPHSTPDVIHALNDPEVASLLSRYRVLSKRELRSRYEISMELYIKRIHVEVKTSLKIAKTSILPAAQKYIERLAKNKTALATLQIEGAHQDGCPWESTATQFSGHVRDLLHAIHALEKASDDAPQGVHDETVYYYRDALLPAMNKLRACADAIECMIDDELWPLPTFHEMLFMK